MLIGGVDERLKELLLEKAKSIDVEIVKMEVMPDHVHLFIKTPPTLAVHFVVNQFKGYTSRLLRNEMPWLSLHFGLVLITAKVLDTYQKKPLRDTLKIKRNNAFIPRLKAVGILAIGSL